MRDAVSFSQIEQILEILDDRDINRELIVIPLGCQDPGGVSKLSGGRIKVVVPESGDFDAWVEAIEPEILAALGHDE